MTFAFFSLDVVAIIKKIYTSILMIAHEVASRFGAKSNQIFNRAYMEIKTIDLVLYLLNVSANSSRM